MRLKHYRLQNPEPGETGGTDAVIESATVETPVVEETQSTAPPDHEASISALLDQVGKEPEAKTDAPPVEKTDPAKPDPLKPVTDTKTEDLTPPEGLSERAKARFTQLAERVKEVPALEQKVTEVTQQLESVRAMVAESGLAQEEFTDLLNMGRMFKSSNPQEMQQTMQLLDGLRADLAIRLGVDAPGVDVLAKFPDLAERVNGMTLSKEDAIEIAKLRNVNQTVQTTQKSQQEMQEFQQGVQGAAQRMDATLNQRAGQPGHAEKIAHVRAYLSDPARLQSFVTTYQPNQWEAAVLMMYDSFTPQAPAPRIPSVQPLRPGHVASGTRQASNRPVSANNAVSSAIESLGL